MATSADEVHGPTLVATPLFGSVARKEGGINMH
jgi:hypothetical protein